MIMGWEFFLYFGCQDTYNVENEHRSHSVFLSVVLGVYAMQDCMSG